MGEGCKALNVNTEQARERVGLGVAELWELCRDVLHRAMPLAQLHTGKGRALTDGSGGRRETVGGQCRGQRLGACRDVLAGVGELRGIPLLGVVAALLGELAHGILAGMIGEKTQRRRGDVVAVTAQTNVTGLGQDVCAGRATTTAAERTSGDELMLLDGTLFGKMVKVTANRGGSQSQARGQGTRGERAQLGDRLSHPVPGARLEDVLAGVGPLSRLGDAARSDKHNMSVT